MTARRGVGRILKMSIGPKILFLVFITFLFHLNWSWLLIAL